MSRRATNFNSIKVRLKPVALSRAQALYTFQFHKGTIKTCRNIRKYKILMIFQFHKGTIKTNLQNTQAASKAISIP